MPPCCLASSGTRRCSGTCGTACPFPIPRRTPGPSSRPCWRRTWEDVAIGRLSLFRQGNIHRCAAELGYYLGRAYWGRGIMTWAVEAACQWAFAHTDLLRISAAPFARNLPSCRVLEKAGFQLEGTLRQSAVKDGEVLEMKLYARLRDG